MPARAEWEKQVKGAAEEEEDLEVFEETGIANADPDVGIGDDRTSAQASLPVDTGETAQLEQQSGMSIP